MTCYNFTDYFETEVLRKRPYLKREWCIHVIENAIRSEPQGVDRYRFWVAIPELEGPYLRVITLEDRVTIHNASPTAGSSHEAQLSRRDGFSLYRS
jgi:hypothetical protein